METDGGGPAAVTERSPSNEMTMMMPMLCRPRPHPSTSTETERVYLCMESNYVFAALIGICAPGSWWIWFWTGTCPNRFTSLGMLVALAVFSAISYCFPEERRCLKNILSPWRWSVGPAGWSTEIWHHQLPAISFKQASSRSVFVSTVHNNMIMVARS
jgi:hypothetical protein